MLSRFIGISILIRPRIKFGVTLFPIRGDVVVFHFIEKQKSVTTKTQRRKENKKLSTFVT